MFYPSSNNPLLGELNSGIPGSLVLYPHCDKIVLLMHMDGDHLGTTFIDEVGHSVYRYGELVTDTAIKKFGVSSALFDGLGDYAILENSADFYMASEDYTWSCYVYITEYPTTSDYCIIGNTDNTLGGQGMSIRINSSGYVLAGFIWSDGVTNNGTQSLTPVPLNTLCHIAAVRHGNTHRTYLNGIGGTPVVKSGSVWHAAQPLGIGLQNNLTTHRYFKGRIDELCIWKGAAVWEADFIPPFAPITLCGESDLVRLDKYLSVSRDLLSGIFAGILTVPISRQILSFFELSIAISRSIFDERFRVTLAISRDISSVTALSIPLQISRSVSEAALLIVPLTISRTISPNTVLKELQISRTLDAMAIFLLTVQAAREIVTEGFTSTLSISRAYAQPISLYMQISRSAEAFVLIERILQISRQEIVSVSMLQLVSRTIEPILALQIAVAREVSGAGSFSSATITLSLSRTLLAEALIANQLQISRTVSR